mgnify:FL=1
MVTCAATGPVIVSIANDRIVNKRRIIAPNPNPYMRYAKPGGDCPAMNAAAIRVYSAPDRVETPG